MLPVNILYKDPTALAIETQHLNIICAYFPPHTIASDIVAQVAEAVQHIPQNNKPTLLAGDFNVRIDQQTSRADIVNEHFIQMGFILESKAEMKTYLCHNGSSTIDLVYTRQIKHSEITYAELALLNGFKKHQPIQAVVHIPGTDKHENRTTPQVKTLNMVTFGKATRCVEENMQHLVATQGIDHVVEQVNTIFHNNSKNKTPKMRKQTPFFDKECEHLRNAMLHYRHLSVQDKSWSEWYTYSRKIYHRVLEEKKRVHTDNIHMTKVLSSEQKPYMYLKPKYAGNIPNALSTEQMRCFLKETFSKPNINIELQNADAAICGIKHCNTNSCYLNMPILETEVDSAITKLKLNKAPGPDGITNNAIKQAKDCIKTLYVNLFNKILEEGTLPSQWKKANMKLLFKGKGSKSEPANYRTVAMENTQMKLLASIVNTRISTHIQNALPDEQYGFRKHRRTTDAVEKLLIAINNARQQNKPLYTVFIDFSQAFNLTNRTQALTKMYTRFNIHGNIIKIMKSFLDENLIQIYTDEEPIRITQNIGTPQGNCLSSTNFIIDIADLFDVLRNTGCDIGAYADDIAFYHTEAAPIHEALKKLHAWCLESGMIVNVSKTKIMKFRRCGPLKKSDTFKYNETTIEIVNTFTYLGITLQTTGFTFTEHIERRLAQLFLEMYKLEDIHTLSINTALQLFHMKLSPIMEYGIKSIWPYLSTGQLGKIDTALSRYLKHICRVSKYARNRVLYIICDTPTYTNILRNKHNLSATKAYEKYTQELCGKMQMVDPELFETPAMTQQMWKDCLQTDRHVITRHAVHGFHHHICTRKDLHQADEQCTCRLCGQTANQYHILKCINRTLPLRYYAELST